MGNKSIRPFGKKDEIGYVFAEVLENAGIYKDDENGRNGFDAFIAKINE